LKKSWTIELEGSRHTVEFQQGWTIASRKILLDGEPLKPDAGEKRGLWGDSEIPFHIGEHPAMLTIRSNGISNSYDLFLDGISVSSGKPYAPLLPTPFWGWIFAVLCALIPLLSMGGAFPILFGLGGATGCIMIARDSKRKTGTRLALCVGITLLTWLLFIIMLGVASTIPMAAG